jgi:hypothetical protein
MADEVTNRADEILEQALAASGARDPREFYRDQLRELKQRNPAGYEGAVRYYRDTLIPSVANKEQPPLDAWTEYGRRLAVAIAPGRPREGRSPSTRPAERFHSRDRGPVAWFCTCQKRTAGRCSWDFPPL